MRCRQQARQIPSRSLGPLRAEKIDGVLMVKEAVDRGRACCHGGDHVVEYQVLSRRLDSRCCGKSRGRTHGQVVLFAKDRKRGEDHDLAGVLAYKLFCCGEDARMTKQSVKVHRRAVRKEGMKRCLQRIAGFLRADSTGHVKER